jgi:hypothetical protein
MNQISRSFAGPLGLTFALSASLAGLAGCVDALDAKSAHDHGKGTNQLYDATYDQAWAAAHAAIVWNQVGAVADHPEEHYLLTDPTNNDQVGVWLTAEGDKTRVNVVVIDDPHLNGPNEEGVQKDIAAAIQLVKAGQPTDKRPKLP